jgi:hypothetical protein
MKANHWELGTKQSKRTKNKKKKKKKKEEESYELLKRHFFVLEVSIISFPPQYKARKNHLPHKSTPRAATHLHKARRNHLPHTSTPRVATNRTPYLLDGTLRFK